MPGETEKNRLYTSGQMAELNGVSRKTLRLYQQKGVLEVLLLPARPIKFILLCVSF